MTREHWETLPLCPTCRHLSYKLPHNIPHLNFISAYFEAISGISFQYWQLQVLTQGWRRDIILVTWSSLQYCRKCQKWSKRYSFYKQFTRYLAPSYSEIAVFLCNFLFHEKKLNCDFRFLCYPCSFVNGSFFLLHKFLTKVIYIIHLNVPHF